MGGEWIMGKFVTASALTLLITAIVLAGQGLAQSVPAGTPSGQAPSGQAPAGSTPTATPTAPAAQSPESSQEATDEVSSSRRKKVHDYKNWNFNVGAGANVDSGTTKTF